MTARNVALAGNAFLTTPGSGVGTVINEHGLASWNNRSTICSAYFRMTSAGAVTVGLNAHLYSISICIVVQHERDDLLRARLCQ